MSQWQPNEFHCEHESIDEINGRWRLKGINNEIIMKIFEEEKQAVGRCMEASAAKGVTNQWGDQRARIVHVNIVIANKRNKVGVEWAAGKIQRFTVDRKCAKGRSPTVRSPLSWYTYDEIRNGWCHN